MTEHSTMRRKLGTVLAWIVATLVSIALAMSAVGSVRNEVTNRPAPLRATAETVAQLQPAETTVTTEVTTTAATSTIVATTPPPPSTTAATTTSKAPQNATSSTTTTSPPTTTAAPTTTSTTTTAAPGSDYFETVQLIGGWVRLRVSGDDVFLDGAVPSPGFSLDIKKDGPESVEVEFESDSHESKLHAEISDGELKIDKEEDDEN